MYLSSGARHPTKIYFSDFRNFLSTHMSCYFLEHSLVPGTAGKIRESANADRDPPQSAGSRLVVFLGENRALKARQRAP